MSPEQEVARQVMDRLVVKHGGNPADVRQVERSYRWTEPDGREAAVGWVS